MKYLSSTELSCLLDLILDINQNLCELVEKFKEAFSPCRFLAVCHELRTVFRELVASSEGVGLVSSLVLIDCMRNTDCLEAKVLFFDVTVELERAIRKDMFLLEQVKYTSKEAKSKQKGFEAALADVLRIHSSAKSFVFSLLAGRDVLCVKAISVVLVTQEAVDSALDGWEKNALQIKEALSDVTHSWLVEKERKQISVKEDCAAVFCSRPTGRAALTLPFAPVKMPTVPVTAGELQFLLPHVHSFLFFDDEAYSADWAKAKLLIERSHNEALTKDEEQALMQCLNEKVIQRIGICLKALCDIAVHNPEVCAIILLKLPPTHASFCIQGLLKSDISVESLQTVLLHGSKALQQINVHTYISDRLQWFKDNSPLSAYDKCALRSFALVLHQLVTKASKENKEIYIADAFYSDLSNLFQGCDTPEILSRWDEMKA